MTPATALTLTLPTTRSLAFSLALARTRLCAALSVITAAAALAGTRPGPARTCFVSSWHCCHLLMGVEFSMTAFPPATTPSASRHGKCRYQLISRCISVEHVFHIAADKRYQLNPAVFDDAGGKLGNSAANQHINLHLVQGPGQPPGHFRKKRHMLSLDDFAIFNFRDQQGARGVKHR